MKKRILVTSIGGIFSHDLIRALRMHKNTYIVGTDIKYTTKYKSLNNQEVTLLNKGVQRIDMSNNTLTLVDTIAPNTTNLLNDLGPSLIFTIYLSFSNPTYSSFFLLELLIL